MNSFGFSSKCGLIAHSKERMASFVPKTVGTRSSSLPDFRRSPWGFNRLGLFRISNVGHVTFLFFVLAIVGARPAMAQVFGCSPAMANDIVCENSKAGNPSSEWDVYQIGDETIQGFATDMSVNRGQTISFKINTNAKAYTIDIYRMGYYGGMGARKVASVTPSVSLPQTQPACLSDSATYLYDCGTWAVSASWAVPSNATSGIYFAHLVRSDTGGDSHIVFIVRNDASHSDILFQTADESWQAYNSYGGHSLYGGDQSFDLPNRAFKVSYNRPFYTRGFDCESATWVFGAEYPMVRWLEANGYDVTYFTGIDAARSGSLILNHKLYMTTGHDEYWSGPHRTNVEAARDAGVNMAFFSGNEVFWKTRWENSIDGKNTPYRTLVCYKETLSFAKTDPQDPPTWTGTWRDQSFSPPADGGRPENSLTGTIFMVNGPGTDNDGSLSITVPAADGKMRFWRNTTIASLAAGATYKLPMGTLGYEWDVDSDNGSRPAGAFDLSTTTQTLTSDYLLDLGATYGAGTATHRMVMYKAKSGALVFGAGTVQWSWGLDADHDNAFFSPNLNPDPNMQQATVNLFADMGVQPASVQGGLSLASKSTDTTPPVSKISSPTSGASVPAGSPAAISGTATDSGGGVVAGVEVSTDSGQTWHPATGRGTWSYSWTPSTLGTFSILSRAVDDSGNLETPSAGASITVAAHDCPCEGWTSSSTPIAVDSGDGGSIEVGVKFRADYDGYISGIRFYKSSTNTGTHIGNLWTSAGALLATATFTSETASGWQQVNFGTPIAITANTTYVASYFAPNGHYSADSEYFALKGLDNPPVHLLQNGVDGPNGVYNYSSSSVFPSSTYNSANYWVDVVYMPAGSMPGAPPALLASPGTLSFLAVQGGANPASQPVTLHNEGTGALNWTATSSAPWIVLSSATGSTPGTLNVSANVSGLAAGSYSGTITINAPGSNNPAQVVNVNLTVTNILLSTTFPDLRGWVVSPLGNLNNWSVSNQTAVYNGGGPSQVFAGNSVWMDYTLSVDIKLSSLTNYPGGIRGRINPATGAGYDVWLYPAQGLVRLYKNNAWSMDTGVLTQLGVGSASFDTANFHTVQLAFQGSQIEVLYDGKVVITATDSTYPSGLIALDTYNQPISFRNVSVTASTTNTGTISVSPNSLGFSANYLGSNPASQSAQVTAGGGAMLAWTATSTASWLSVTPVSGTTPATLQVSVASSTLAGGNYTGTIQVVSLGAVTTTQAITVNLTVVLPPPSLLVSPSSFNFVTYQGQSPPAAQILSVMNGGSGGFSWTASSSSSWLSVSPVSGSSPAAVSIGVNNAGLATGTYTGIVTVTAPGIINSPQAVPVTLQVLSLDMSENFSDFGNGWIVSPMGNAAGWGVSSGVFTYSGSGLSQMCAGNSAWTNYTFDANIRLASTANWPGGVRARVNPSTGAGYAVWLYPSSGLAILYKVGVWNINDSSLTLLAQAPLAFDTNVHDLQVAFYGQQITVSWDGRQLMTGTDASYTNGYVCLDTDNQPISYSNLRVAGVQSPVTLDAPSPTSLAFSALPGVTPGPRSINITAAGATTTWVVTSNQPWLTATASTTLTPGVITASVNPTGLPGGVYNGTLTVYAPGATNSPLTIPVTFAIKTAVLSVTPTSLYFFGATTASPLPQTIQVANLGTGVLGWSATATSPWLGLGASTGAAPSTITVSPNTTQLASGSYSDTITITSPDAISSPAQVSIFTQVGTLVFSDDFSAGAGNWTIGPLGYSSGWSIVNGSYTYNGGGPTQAWAGSNTWTNYTVAMNFQLASASNYPGGLRGRLNISTGASYGAWVYPAQGIIRLYRIGQWNIDADNSLLGTASNLRMDTNVHNLRLNFQGTTIQVYYDNVLVITATDSNYAQGVVALDVSNQPVTYKDVSVITSP